MSIHQLRQIEKVKRMILALGGLVEEALENAIRAFQAGDVALAKKIVQADTQVDQMEIDVEEECLHTLALYQPVALDLRYVVAVLKINNDLERIADLAVNVAEQTGFLQQKSFSVSKFDLTLTAKKVRAMLKHSLDSLVNMDTSLAQQVRSMDDEVDDLHRAMYVQVEKAISDQPEHVVSLISVLNVSRYLERIADHAVNIAEDVIYMARGEILRHRRIHEIAKPDPFANTGSFPEI